MEKKRRRDKVPAFVDNVELERIVSSLGFSECLDRLLKVTTSKITRKKYLEIKELGSLDRLFNKNKRYLAHSLRVKLGYTSVYIFLSELKQRGNLTLEQYKFLGRPKRKMPLVVAKQAHQNKTIIRKRSTDSQSNETKK